MLLHYLALVLDICVAESNAIAKSQTGSTNPCKTPLPVPVTIVTSAKPRLTPWANATRGAAGRIHQVASSMRPTCNAWPSHGSSLHAMPSDAPIPHPSRTMMTASQQALQLHVWNLGSMKLMKCDDIDAAKKMNENER